MPVAAHTVTELKRSSGIRVSPLQQLVHSVSQVLTSSYQVLTVIVHLVLYSAE